MDKGVIRGLGGTIASKPRGGFIPKPGGPDPLPKDEVNMKEWAEKCPTKGV